MKPISPPSPQEQHRKHEHDAIDPDPKAHPFHRDVPSQQPIEHGTDPKHPVAPPKEHR
ncbi:MAG TPA: hypothetical protein VIF62_18965 [Labilithrix sp.]